VFGFLLPRGHEVWLDSDDFVGWEQQTSAAVVYYTTYLPSPVQAQMRSLSDQYRNDFSRTTQTYYWMNHCDHCGMKQGDFELFEEFDTPFCPADVRDACRILLHPVHEPFEVSATSIAYEPGFFERMRVLPSR
jgi:hypothetical protein